MSFFPFVVGGNEAQAPRFDQGAIAAAWRNSAGTAHKPMTQT
jgi:hypothetical protein